jgi:tRNA-2-methylthio-N6-dimethylallyladenosine synthase
MNYSDSARIKAVLLNCGFSCVDNEQDADIIIFDTCSVRQKAEDKITGKLQDIPSSKKIRITGCMIQHNFRNSPLMKGGRNKATGDSNKKGNFL